MHEPVGLETFEAASLLAKNDFTLTYKYICMPLQHFTLAFSH